MVESSIGGVGEQVKLEGISFVLPSHFATCFLISNYFYLRAMVLSNFQFG